MNKYAANLMLFSKLGQFCQDTCQGNDLTSSIVDSWRICSNNLGATRETERLERTGYNFLKLLKLLCFLTMLSCCCKVYSQPSPTKCVGYCSACNVDSQGTIVNKPSFLCLTTGLQRCLLQDRQDPHISDRWPRSHRWSGENPMKTYFSRANRVNIGIFFPRSSCGQTGCNDLSLVLRQGLDSCRSDRGENLLISRRCSGVTWQFLCANNVFKHFRYTYVHSAA